MMCDDDDDDEKKYGDVQARRRAVPELWRWSGEVWR
jgi:hypothetical protein